MDSTAIATTMPPGRYGARHIARWSVSLASCEALYAAIGRVLAPYRPGGRHGHRRHRWSKPAVASYFSSSDCPGDDGSDVGRSRTEPPFFGPVVAMHPRRGIRRARHDAHVHDDRVEEEDQYL